MEAQDATPAPETPVESLRLAVDRSRLSVSLIEAPSGRLHALSDSAANLLEFDADGVDSYHGGAEIVEASTDSHIKLSRQLNMYAAALEAA